MSLDQWLQKYYYNTDELTPCRYPYTPYSKNFGKYYFNHRNFLPILSTEEFRHTFFTVKVFYYTVIEEYTQSNVDRVGQFNHAKCLNVANLCNYSLVEHIPYSLG